VGAASSENAYDFIKIQVWWRNFNQRQLLSKLYTLEQFRLNTETRYLIQDGNSRRRESFLSELEREAV